MSSIVGHAAAGVTAYLCSARSNRRTRGSLLPFVVLAVCADIDYLAVWLAGYDATPRFTHSFLFALSAAVLVHCILRRCTTLRLPVVWLMVASASHPVLDLLVGAHPVPLLWPFGADVSIAVGVLPSAGTLKLGNYYLWRNLLIELGVLLPVFALCVAMSRRVAVAPLTAWAAGIAPFWAMFVVWSLSLTR
ncbi:metal-dependent hydrolase [Stenotrophomonas sp. PD6]|uniref:metal-dependent hydrolase n=1 Tax=Stenotrophomonas sp. PD6 TaxID=3368612 RepID=UPI003BA2E359